MSRVLFQSHDDGHEEDPALAVALSLTVHPQVGPVFEFVGPNGSVELIGAQAAREVADAIYRVLRPASVSPSVARKVEGVS